MEKLIYKITMYRSKFFLKKQYGNNFYRNFKIISGKYFDSILPKVPDIGKSIFALNYKFGPSYIAWYKAFMKMGLTQQEIIKNIWVMNEKMVTTVPRPFLKTIGKMYLNGFRKKAAAHMVLQQDKKLHPYDWKVVYREIDKDSFELDITECGLKKLTHDFDADGLLPGICRMDYMLSNLMGNGFVRTKTLGDGDYCCNCHYELAGKCDWSPEKGFVDRK